ncbi:hypothetical protein KUTeg_024186 [Tegillarca granosa]|uniref:Uncharacterized protein n=1 Tax=Tegillarca granosa TaxID=220873 RepID=A0ABQ9E2D6_TEGGR|nr:hypothetical protein KUTeg_024186 [Tegillarca granosa]
MNAKIQMHKACKTNNNYYYCDNAWIGMQEKFTGVLISIKMKSDNIEIINYYKMYCEHEMNRL